MSTTASRYADYGSACPRCQQIINTIDITFQQGIFIYDLTFIQQELESVLVAALQRQNQLLQQDGQELKLPLSSMIRLANGKKPRDFKAERDRRRKALSGHVSRKRRIKKSSTINFLKTIKRERNQNGLTSLKKNSLRSEINENSSRPSRLYRPINFTSFPYYYETNHRNGNNHNLSTNKLQLNNILYPDQFWIKILNNQHEYLFSKNKYLHPELEYSIVLKHNSHLYNFVENISNNNQHKNSSASNNHRLKRKYSTISNNHNSIQIDDSILEFFRRDNK
jgi:hypothetical protein